MRYFGGYENYLRHWLFRIVRQVAMRRSGGKCERCGEVATEVHHNAYPTWGAFDTPGNIIAVCHACHCVIEKKER